MATSERDRQIEADMQAARAQDARKALILTAVVGLVGAATVLTNIPDVVSGSVPAVGQALVGLLGVEAAVLMRLQPRTGWLHALAWALVQIPFYAWTPDGSPTAQLIQIPLTMTSSSSINGQLVSYTSIGINVAGLIFVAWLRAWEQKFPRS